jgi:hypothetical protein
MNRDASGQLAPFLVLTILVLMIGFATNLHYQFVPVSPLLHGDKLTGVSNLQTKSDVSMAGFPMTFSKSIWSAPSSTNQNESDNLPTSSAVAKDEGAILVVDWFSLYALAVNVLVWLAIAGLVVGVLRWRLRWMKDEFQFANRRRILEIFVAISILAIPCVYFGYHALRLRKQNRLIDEISKYGACGTVTWLPRCIADQVPRALHPILGQIHLVSVYEPTPALLQKLGQLPLLQSLRIHGQTGLEPLANSGMGTSMLGLSLVRTTLGPSHNRFFETHPQLQELHAYLVSGGESEMKAICELPNVRHLIMEDCELPIQELSQAKSSGSVEILAVAIGVHPEEEISIVGWPHLREVSAIQRGNRSKPWTTKVRFHHCPQLERVSLDGLRRYDAEFVSNAELTLVNPAFRNDTFNDVRAFATFDQQYDRIVLRNCPKLQTFSFSLVGVEDLDIADAGGLTEVSCTAYQPTRHSLFRLAKIAPDLVDRLLDQIGRVPTLERLTLGGVPVNTSNLALINTLPSLGELHFHYTAPDSSQLKLLEPLQSLIQIDLPNCKLQDENLTFLLNRFPKLTGATIDVSGIKNLQLNGSSQCKWISSTPFSSIEFFHFSNPKFQSGFHLGSSLKSLKIENSPKLDALVVDAPLPPDTRLKDLRDIKIFMVGGNHVDDKIFDSIENCGSLERLMLAYTSISKENFKSIGNFSLLRGLSVPGNPVDDDTIRHWSDLTELWSLDLSETQVDVAAIRWAIANKSLRYLNLSGVRLSKEAKTMLAELSQLTFLSVAHTDISPTELSNILRNSSLIYLDLSGIPLTTEHFDALAQSKPPNLIIARGCGFPVAQLEDYCKRQSSGSWDIGSTHLGLLPRPSDDSLNDSAPINVSETKLENRLVVDGVIHSYHHSISYSKNVDMDGEAKPQPGTRTNTAEDFTRNNPQRFLGMSLQAAGELATWDTSAYRAEKLALHSETALSAENQTKNE